MYFVHWRESFDDYTAWMPEDGVVELVARLRAFGWGPGKDGAGEATLYDIIEGTNCKPRFVSELGDL